MAGISGRDVISFFKNADLELAELVLEFGQTAVEARIEARAKISANLKKARAARKPAGSGTAATPEQPGNVEAPAPVEVVAEAPAPVTRRGPGRPTHTHVSVPAPAHTAEATAATSD